MIDVHSHVVPEALLGEIGRHPGLGISVRETPQGPCLRFGSGVETRPVFPAIRDPHRHFAEGEGPDQSYLSLWPDLSGFELPSEGQRAWTELVNSVIGETAGQQGDRAWAQLPLGSPEDAAQTLLRWMDRGMVGGIIPSNVLGIYLDDPRFEPLWTAAESRSAPLLMHPLNVAGEERMDRYYIRAVVGYPTDTTLCLGRMILGGVFERHPGLKVVAVHGGGYLPWAMGRLEHTHEHEAQAQLSGIRPPRAYWHQIWFDSLVHAPEVLRWLVQAAPGRVTVGTDNPFAVGEFRPRSFVEGALAGDAAAIQDVLDDAARRLCAAPKGA